MLKSVWSIGGWGISLTRPMLESVSSLGGWGVSLTRPMLKSDRRIRSFSCMSHAGIYSGINLVGSFIYTPCAEVYNNNNNNNDNGDLYSALTEISTTRFTIAMYK